MRVRTSSACVVLALGIIALIMTAAASSGPLRLAQANIRIAGNTSITKITNHNTRTTTTHSESGVVPATLARWVTSTAASARTAVSTQPVADTQVASVPAPASASASASARGRAHARLAHTAAVAGLPRWLEIVLLAAGLLIGAAFLTEPTLTIARRRPAARPSARARIVLADYDRLVVTHDGADGTVCVLRPPDADPEAILLAARLVLAQDRYEELAGHLGVPAHWPRE
jgi:hypothetical protein